MAYFHFFLLICFFALENRKSAASTLDLLSASMSAISSISSSNSKLSSIVSESISIILKLVSKLISECDADSNSNGRKVAISSSIGVFCWICAINCCTAM